LSLRSKPALYPEFAFALVIETVLVIAIEFVIAFEFALAP
jgi:hypothetical protein